jgi:hypothetical protein
MADPQNFKDKAKDLAASAGQAATEAKDRAREAASTLAGKAGEVASNLGTRAQEYASRAADRTDDALASAGEGMRSLAGTLRERAPHEGMLGSAASSVAAGLERGGEYLQEHGLADIGDDLTNLVRQYPVASLLTVFGIGFLMGSALRR